MTFRGAPPADPGSRAAILRALAHRGPDGQGWFEESSDGASVRLGHTRLKIIDLSDAASQPMAGSDSRTRLVFNGEIYGFAELRRELERSGHRFRSHSDTEVLLHALEEWGTGALARLSGMFAFALWDGRDRSLLVARDRLGIKPLYCTATPSRVAVASEVRALLASGNVPFRVDPTGVASFFALGSVAARSSLVEGVRTLAAGTWMRITERGSESGTFWKPPSSAASRPADRREAASRVRGILQAAVESHLVADVPVGVFLSGGMDSRAIAELAARAGTSKVETFTVSFESAHDATDERHAAARTASSVGLVHRVIELPVEACLAELPHVVGALDLPSIDGPNTYFVSKAVRAAGIGVALSGLGGDELFAGYEHLRRAHLARWLLAGLRHLPGAAVPSAGARGVRFGKALALLATGGRPAAIYAVQRGLFLRGIDDALFTPEALRAWGARTDEFLSGLDEIDGAPVAEAEAILELRNYLADTLLHTTDAMSMRHGLEVRVPFLDHRLVEYVLGLPIGWRIRRGLQKPLLAEAMGHAPVASGSKTGFTLPFARWLRTGMRAEVESRLAALEHAGAWVRPEGVTALWKRFLAGDSRLWSRLWAIYVMDAWIARNGATRKAA